MRELGGAELSQSKLERGLTFRRGGGRLRQLGDDLRREVRTDRERESTVAAVKKPLDSVVVLSDA